jgi:hypothetical protein
LLWIEFDKIVSQSNPSICSSRWASSIRVGSRARR